MWLYRRRRTPVIRPQSARDPTVRDRHIAQIRSKRPHGLAGGHRVQPAQPDRNADRPVEERHRPQTQILQLLQADHGDPGRPESPEHNDRTRTACVRTYRLTLPLGKGRIPSPPRSMQQRYFQRRQYRSLPPRDAVEVEKGYGGAGCDSGPSGRTCRAGACGTVGLDLPESNA